MNYAELITETADELQELENQQKLVQMQKRVGFLHALKTGAATTQAQAGLVVGWKLRPLAKDLEVVRRGRHHGSVAQTEAMGRVASLSSQQIARLQNHLAEFGAADLRAVQAVCADLIVNRVMQVIAAMQLLVEADFGNQIAGFRKLAHRRLQFPCDVRSYYQLRLDNLLKSLHADIVPQGCAGGHLNLTSGGDSSAA